MTARSGGVLVGQAPAAAVGHGHRERRLRAPSGQWRFACRAPASTRPRAAPHRRAAVIPAYERRTRQAEALIAGGLCVGHEYPPACAGR